MYAASDPDKSSPPKHNRNPTHLPSSLPSVAFSLPLRACPTPLPLLTPTPVACFLLRPFAAIDTGPTTTPTTAAAAILGDGSRYLSFCCDNYRRRCLLLLPRYLRCRNIRCRLGLGLYALS